MSIFYSLKNFFFRCCVYAVILLWPAIRLTNIDSQIDHLAQILKSLFAFYGLKNKVFKDIANDPSFYLISYSILEIIFGILGVFGSFTGGIVSMFLFLFVNFIYFNPFLPENKISLYGTRQEIFFNIGVFFALSVVTFYPYELTNKKKVEENEEESDTKPEENKQTKKQRKKTK